MKQSPEITHELQQVELDIFRAFVDVCEKLDIKYYVIAGTLLGAVRHGGFIPWDDDIDVGIMRKDYEKFIAEAPKLLPRHIFLQTYQTDPEFPHVYAKLRNENTAFIECSVKDNFMSHGVFIDVFPLDFCDLRKRNSTLFKIKERVYNLRSSSLMKNYKLDLKRRVLRQACKVICLNPHKALVKLDRLYQSMPNGNYVVNFSGVYGECEIMPVHWYGDPIVLNFEDVKVLAPADYDKWLSRVYGDYMVPPPEETRGTQHSVYVIDVKTSYKNYR